MSELYCHSTPILEAVFADLSPEAANIADIYLQGHARDWHHGPLSYPELAEWTDEIAPETPHVPAATGSQ